MKERHFLSFKNRLFTAFFFLFFVFILCFFFFQYKREKLFKEEILNNILIEYSNNIYHKIKEQEIRKKDLTDFVQTNHHSHFRVTIIDFKGNVLFDSQDNGEIQFDNHLSRKEISLAQKEGNSYSFRLSKTFNTKFFYSATAFPDYIIRCSLPYDISLKHSMDVDRTFIVFSSIMFILMTALLYFFASHIGISISRLKKFAQNADKNKTLEINEFDFPNDELGEISEHIIKLYNRLNKAKNKISSERDKLEKHFDLALEGVTVFDKNKNPILSNRLFFHFLNLISDVNLIDAKNCFKLEQFKPIVAFLDKDIKEETIEQLLRKSTQIEKNGKIFAVECMIFKDRTFEISIQDITQKEQDGILKRQLTQNISHELKTPVSSIQGYLETIIANPQLSETKKQQFIQRCFAQAKRLALLLSDISLLNRMDEAHHLFSQNKVNLSIMVEEIHQDVSILLNNKNMQLVTTISKQVEINGNQALLYSIFRNLIDNAIAYAGEETTISIQCYKEDSEFYYFSVADNGIGIDPTHFNRIFERFYRIDKGRTRKTGGTGLGLSIVKNAIQMHKGSISAKQRSAGGLEFLFTLKK